MKSTIFAILILYSMPIFSEENDEFLGCSLAGFFKGEGSSFLHEIAVWIVAQNNQFDTPECQEKMRAATTIGKYYLENGRFKYEKDKEILQHVAIFKAKIRRFIIEGADLNSRSREK